jgi:hypothetical protein
MNFKGVEEMNSKKVIFKALDRYITSSGKRVLKKVAAPAIKQGTFDMVDEPKGEYFTAGFGKEIMLPDDIKEHKYYIAGYKIQQPGKGSHRPPVRPCALA